MKNRIQKFLREREISAYRFIEDTGVSPSTGYELARNPDHLPSLKILEAICDTYQQPPEVFIEWIPKAKDANH
jgi:transcriptional regulator with XRE-family HTH domain